VLVPTVEEMKNYAVGCIASHPFGGLRAGSFAMDTKEWGNLDYDGAGIRWPAPKNGRLALRGANHIE
jgi:hypothetical protein